MIDSTTPRKRGVWMTTRPRGGGRAGVYGSRRGARPPAGLTGPRFRSPGRVEGARPRHRGNLTHGGKAVDVSGGDGHAGCDGDDHDEVLSWRDVHGGSSARSAPRRRG